MPRQITRTAFKYDELGDKAKENAREAIYGMLSAAGSVTEILRETAADWLTNEGWTGLADLRDGSQADLDIFQFSISHSQSDFVAWNSTRPVGGWLPEGEVIVITQMRHYGASVMGMDVAVSDDEGNEIEDSEIQVRAEQMVREHRAKVLSLMHDTDLGLTEDEEYLSEYALNAEIEFWEDGRLASW